MKKEKFSCLVTLILSAALIPCAIEPKVLTGSGNLFHHTRLSNLSLYIHLWESLLSVCLHPNTTSSTTGGGRNGVYIPEETAGSGFAPAPLSCYLSTAGVGCSVFPCSHQGCCVQLHRLWSSQLQRSAYTSGSAPSTWGGPAFRLVGHGFAPKPGACVLNLGCCWSHPKDF